MLGCMLSGLEDTADNGPKVNTYNLRSEEHGVCIRLLKTTVLNGFEGGGRGDTRRGLRLCGLRKIRGRAQRALRAARRPSPHL